VVANTLDPVVHLFMDASDQGLCVLYPAAKDYIRLEFDVEERDSMRPTSTSAPPFSINVREALSVTLAALIWGPHWAPFGVRLPVHVRCWLDNTSAAAWYDRKYSRNALGQELNRVLACCEIVFRIHVSTAHLPGSANSMADLGSRAWNPPSVRQWNNLTASWSEQRVPSRYRKIYASDSWNSNGVHSPTPRAASTYPPGM
jgi:hypothetical protein